jgi:hypothetical protein
VIAFKGEFERSSTAYRVSVTSNRRRRTWRVLWQHGDNPVEPASCPVGQIQRKTLPKFCFNDGAADSNLGSTA